MQEKEHLVIRTLILEVFNDAPKCHYSLYRMWFTSQLFAFIGLNHTDVLRKRLKILLWITPLRRLMHAGLHYFELIHLHSRSPKVIIWVAITHDMSRHCTSYEHQTERKKKKSTKQLSNFTKNRKKTKYKFYCVGIGHYLYGRAVPKSGSKWFGKSIRTPTCPHRIKEC